MLDVHIAEGLSDPDTVNGIRCQSTSPGHIYIQVIARFADSTVSREHDLVSGNIGKLSIQGIDNVAVYGLKINSTSFSVHGLDIHVTVTLDNIDVTFCPGSNCRIWMQICVQFGTVCRAADGATGRLKNQISADDVGGGCSSRVRVVDRSSALDTDGRARLNGVDVQIDFRTKVNVGIRVDDDITCCSNIYIFPLVDNDFGDLRSNGHVCTGLVGQGGTGRQCQNAAVDTVDRVVGAWRIGVFRNTRYTYAHVGVETVIAPALAVVTGDGVGTPVVRKIHLCDDRRRENFRRNRN